MNNTAHSSTLVSATEKGSASSVRALKHSKSGCPAWRLYRSLNQIVRQMRLQGYIGHDAHANAMKLLDRMDGGKRYQRACREHDLRAQSATVQSHQVSSSAEESVDVKASS
jgi:hypothetical protein